MGVKVILYLSTRCKVKLITMCGIHLCVAYRSVYVVVIDILDIFQSKHQTKKVYLFNYLLGVQLIESGAKMIRGVVPHPLG